LNANGISATKLGAEVSATGSGLPAGAGSYIPTIDAGTIVTGDSLAAGANTTFSYAVSARAADTAASSNALGTGIPTTAFGAKAALTSARPGPPSASAALAHRP